MLNHIKKHSTALIVLIAALSACTTTKIHHTDKEQSITITVHGNVFNGLDSLEEKLKKESAMQCASNSFTILEPDVLDAQETIYYENLSKQARVLSLTRQIVCH